MKHHSSVRILVLLMISMLVLGGPMNQEAVADNGDSFFADFVFSTNPDKLPLLEADNSAREPSLAASSSPTAELFLNRFLEYDTLPVNRTFVLRIMVDPATQSINLADTEIAYSTSTLRLVNVDLAVSDFYMHLVSNNKLDSASIIAMQPWPGIATSSVVADLIFMTVAAGPAEISFTDASMVLANDGLGTDVLKAAVPSNFMIIE